MRNLIVREPPMTIREEKAIVKATILLIDEAQLERKINEWALSHAGYDVLSAADAKQALRLVQNTPADIILIDSLLPDADTRNILAALRRNARTARIPVVILSRAGADFERWKGTAEILEKEKALIDPGCLLDTVEEVLHPVL
jgi:PleD family two-component response regulator